ncbi:hypothetical protein HK102_006151 [Quaeritorhiza haematococci]|nr:hypothetical protein HK102_006151 [Quaeritorhiza haematococci]
MAEQKGRGGHNKQTILLTPDTFKDLCMMAGTPEGKEARQYFRTMEKIVQNYVLMQQTFKDQQLFETQAQLEQQTRLLQAKEDELQKSLSPSRDGPSNSPPTDNAIATIPTPTEVDIITNSDGSLIDLKDYLAQELTTEQQHLFIESAWMYLNRHSECCIDLEVAMQWMGVTGKDKQKKKLVDHFTEGIDYIVYSATVAEINKGRGRPKETILLTPDAFKKLAQMSDGRGKEVRDYFIAMERVVIKYMQMQNAFMTQQLLEAQLQLKQQTQALEAKEHELQAMNNELQKYVNKTYEEIETTGFVYLVKTDGGFKVGRTKNIDQRVGELQTGNAEDIEVLLAFPTSDPVVLEAITHKILDPYRRKSKREYFDCNPAYIATMIKLTGKFLDTMKSSYPCITRPEIMEKLGGKFGTVFQMDAGVNKKIKLNHNDPNVTRFIHDCCVFEATERVHWSSLWNAYQSWKAKNPNVTGHFPGKLGFFNVIKPMLNNDPRVVTKDTKIQGYKAPGVERMGLKTGLNTGEIRGAS